MEEGGEGLRLGAQRKRPRVVREVINHHQIVLITRKAKYRRGPVNKVKCMRRMRRRRRKKEPNMTTELARMAEGLSHSHIVPGSIGSWIGVEDRGSNVYKNAGRRE